MADPAQTSVVRAWGGNGMAGAGGGARVGRVVWVARKVLVLACRWTVFGNSLCRSNGVTHQDRPSWLGAGAAPSTAEPLCKRKRDLGPRSGAQRRRGRKAT